MPILAFVIPPLLHKLQNSRFWIHFELFLHLND
nr:MAG TPA: hypothetical protein [Caudoviricetes sp.]